MPPTKGWAYIVPTTAGMNWRKITDDPRPAMKIGGGDLPVPAVDPQNPDVVYSTSIVTCRSQDGGKTWMSLRGAPGGDDYQNMWINPRDPKILLLVSDQGALVSVNGGDSWSSWYNQPTAQLYHVAATNRFPYQVCAGQQESGSVCTSTRGNDGEITFRDWHPAGIIEYGYAAPDPLHPEIVYGAGRTEVSRYDMVTGQVQNVTPLPMKKKGFRADRTQPIEFSPVDPHTLYYAANHLFVTTDGGQSWKIISPDLSQEKTGQPPSVPPLTTKQQDERRGVIYSIAASYKTTQTIWAGTDDGLVWITRDGGANWTKITPPGVAPWSKIAQIDASRFDDDSAYVAVNRFRVDDLHPYAFRTHDGGKTWTSISAGLPDDAPVNAVRADPCSPDCCMRRRKKPCGYRSTTAIIGEPLQYNLPHTSMRDLLVKDDDLIVATHGRSFWILDDVSPLRQLAGDAGKKVSMLLTPASAWRVRRDTNTDTPLPADEPAGENPPDGAILDYDLSQSAHAVTLEILDSSRKCSAQVQQRRSCRSNSGRIAHGIDSCVLAADARAVAHHGRNASLGLGSTRDRSDGDQLLLSHCSRAASHSAGPARAAGCAGNVYRTFDRGWQERDAAVAGEDGSARPPVAGRVGSICTRRRRRWLRHWMSLPRPICRRTRSWNKWSPCRIQRLAKQLAPSSATLKTILDGTGPNATKRMPGIDEVTAEATLLYGELEQADANPTAALLAAAAHVQNEGKEVLPAWEQFKQTQLPEMNQQIRNAHHPAINPDRKPTNMPEQGDED